MIGLKKIFFANDRIIKILLFLTFVLLSFNYIPQLLRFDTISNGFSRNASWYPLFGLMIYYFSSKKFYKKCDLVTQRMFIFLCLYSFYIFVDTIIGFAKFPYFQEIINGPKDQITKLPKVLSILEFFKLNYTSENITYIWYILRTLKSGIFTILYTFGFSIILFYFIHKDFEKSFNLLRKAVYISLGIICIYSSFEILYLAGSESAKAILAKITPFIFDLYTNGRQYPPLFWYKTQVRSIFIEPSHFGMYAAFVMPILWYNIMKSKRKELFIALTIVLSFLVFMTKARTATLLVIGELFVLMFLLLYFNGKKYLKYIFNIILVVFTGMILSIGFIKYFEMPVAYQMEAKQQATSLKKII